MESVARVADYGSIRRSAEVVPLSQLLPLDTPLSLLIDPSNGCNFKCVFCPTGDAELLATVGRKPKAMRLETFEKIINGLQRFPKRIKVLHLYKDGEPLVNKSLGSMVAIAKQSCRFERIETTTNGALLTKERALELIDAGIDGIRISIYGLDDESYAKATGSNISLEAIRANVASLFELKNQKRSAVHVHCKTIDTNLSSDERRRFFTLFQDISDSIHIDSLMGWSNTRNRDLMLGTQPPTGMSGAPLRPDRKVCSEPFMRLAVNSNGRVSVCCVDWSHETSVGDISEETLFEIWNGERLREFRIKHLEGRRHELQACADCQYLLGLGPHTYLDAHAQELLNRYTN